MQKQLKYFIPFIISAFLVSCAQQIPISGGAKDEEPPVILTSSPGNFTKNFKKDKIVMQFDEYVQVKDLKKELIVSPPLKHDVEHKMRGKKVIFTIKDTLLPNTTYNFNFGKSIVDLNEGNPLDSNLYVFSTGDILDSGMISGIVKNAFDLKPLEDVYVYVYKGKKDSAFYKGYPDYIGRTKSDGTFKIPFISDGDYEVFAIKDKNGSFSYDVKGEEIAFASGMVSTTNKKELQMYMFQEFEKKQYFKSGKQTDFGAINLRFNRKVNGDLKLRGLNTELKGFREWNLNRDSLIFWLQKLPETDTVMIELENKELGKDTAYIAWKSREKYNKKKRKKRKGEKEVIKVAANLNQGIFDYFDTLHLTFDRPVEKVDFSKVMLVEDNDTLGFGKVSSFLKNTLENKKNKRELPIIYDWKAGKNYRLIVFPGAFTDIYGVATDTNKLAISTLKFEDYGNLQFKVNAPQKGHPYVLQLLNKEGKPQKEFYIQPGDKVSFPLMRPASYKFKLIYDKNSNKKWDSGSLDKRRQPEKVIFYKDEINVRANWDIELEWNIKDSSR